MSDEKVIESCEFCKYTSTCSGNVTNYGDGPIFPPCADGDIEHWVDENALIECVRECQDDGH